MDAFPKVRESLGSAGRVEGRLLCGDERPRGLRAWQQGKFSRCRCRVSERPLPCAGLGAAGTPLRAALHAVCAVSLRVCFARVARLLVVQRAGLRSRKPFQHYPRLPYHNRSLSSQRPEKIQGPPPAWPTRTCLRQWQRDDGGRALLNPQEARGCARAGPTGVSLLVVLLGWHPTVSTR